MALYTLRDVRQQYQTRTVLHIEQLDIERGEILAIVGPSGAGKSTLLRHLALLEAPQHGQLTFDGLPYQQAAASLTARRRVTMVFQKPTFLNRSVAANVAYGLGLRGRNGRGGKSAVEGVLRQVGLAELATAAVRTLSGGEAQRVALARALVIQPHALLLDEPTANLDPYNVKLIEQLVQQTNQTQQTTIVLVTHNIFQARRLAHRTALLLEGKLVEVAETNRFFESPADPRTAAFVRGEMVY